MHVSVKIIKKFKTNKKKTENYINKLYYTLLHYTYKI